MRLLLFTRNSFPSDWVCMCVCECECVCVWECMFVYVRAVCLCMIFAPSHSVRRTNSFAHSPHLDYRQDIHYTYKYNTYIRTHRVYCSPCTYVRTNERTRHLQITPIDWTSKYMYSLQVKFITCLLERDENLTLNEMWRFDCFVK